MRISNSLRWLVVVAGAAMLLAVAAACGAETVEVPGETVVVEKVVTETVEVPGETVVVEKEVIKTVEVPGETVTKEVVKEVMVPGETVVVEKVITETVEVPGETVTVEVVKEVMVPGETVVVEKEVVKTVEVPGQTVVVEKVVTETVEVPGETVVVEKVVTQTVEVPGQTVIVEKEVVKTVEVPGPERVVVKEVPGKKYVTDHTTGRVVSAPEYGGTLTWAAAVFEGNPDPWWAGGNAPNFISGVNEKLAHANWGISRDKWNGRQYANWVPGGIKGALAESWSQPDDTTLIFNIRKGVYWDNKAPVNGRELDAYDIEWNYHRLLGLGDFTEDGPTAHKGGVTLGLIIESVTATDKWTVEFKLPRPQFYSLGNSLRNYYFALPREVIEKYGDYKDWRNVVGTGPLRLTEVVEGSSITWEKNPNYWGYDEKFPQNRLPYIDEYRSLHIPDLSTRLAGLRTGKIDMMGTTGNANIYSIDDIVSLQKTNPEIDVWPSYAEGNPSFLFNQSLPLTQDPIVRQAMQMSVDRDTIAATFFKGWATYQPYGLMRQSGLPGWYWPYEDWPEDVKMGHMYDPAGAEALLDEAGYTRGADGYRFKVSFLLSSRYDPSYTEILMGYFQAIGIDSEIVVLPSMGAALRGETAEWHLLSGPYGWDVGSPVWLTTVSQNFGWDAGEPRLNASSWTKAKDPRMDALHLAALETVDAEELKSIFRQADEITVREHWGLGALFAPRFSVSQPWVRSFSGESHLGEAERNTVQARLWIDSELKKAMGR